MESKEIKRQEQKSAKRYGTRAQIADDFGIPKQTLSNEYLSDMKRHPVYAQYLLKPTSHTLLINYDGFEDYLKYRSSIRK